MELEKEIQQNYMSSKDASVILGVNKSRIIQILSAGGFPGAFKFADTWLIPRKSVENYTRQKPGPKSNAEIQALINEAVANALKQKEKEAKRKAKTIQADQSQQLELF